MMKCGPAALVLMMVLTRPAQAELHAGPGRVPFWIGLGSNQQLDPQAMRVLADDAAVVVLRARLEDPESGEPLSALVSRLHSVAPGTPVLLYSLASRYLAKDDRSGRIMGWLAAEPELQVRSKVGKPMESFGDVTKPHYRDRTCAALIQAVEQTGADGVALDLAVRTPNAVLKPLDQRCAEDSGFCTAYAQGMDSLFEELRGGLGGRPILYNGLWNFRPGMVEDQAKLLAHADAAIVEYFGMNPRENSRSFTRDILPYLHAMRSLPEGKKLFVYGRGPWRYADYREDYLWQRYLYGAYLLASGGNTFFKYHASFQVPAHAGRSGGLDTYADWHLALGAARGDYRKDGNIYLRQFQQGLVLVAPDDGQGGEFTLDRPRYTPEGERRAGKVRLESGSALLLLDAPPQSPPPVREIALRPLESWRGARWQQPQDAAGFLALDALPAKSVAALHDILLEQPRSLASYPVLELKVRARSKDAALLVVAEIDDPEHRQHHLVVVLPTEEKAPRPAAGPLPRFRLPELARRGGERRIPYVYAQSLRPDRWQKVVLDPAALELGSYRFRRWSQMRVKANLDLQLLRLQQRKR